MIKIDIGDQEYDVDPEVLKFIEFLLNTIKSMQKDFNDAANNADDLRINMQIMQMKYDLIDDVMQVQDVCNDTNNLPISNE